MEYTKDEQEYLIQYEKKYCSEPLNESQKEYIIGFYRNPITTEEAEKIFYEYYKEEYTFMEEFEKKHFKLSQEEHDKIIDIFPQYREKLPELEKIIIKEH